MSDFGLRLRLSRLFDPTSGRTVIVPVDDSLISGPTGGLVDVPSLVSSVCQAGANAVLGFSSITRTDPGSFGSSAFIYNLTASTVGPTHTTKVQVRAVETAVRQGADAVAFHINLGSQHEPEMLRSAGGIVDRCADLGIPSLGILYPRREGARGDDNYDQLREAEPESFALLLSRAVRVGVELGADLIKTQFVPGDGLFESVVRSALGVPVVIAGGPKVEREAALQMARDAVDAGAAGVSFGRNVFMRTSPASFVSELRQVVNRPRDGVA